MLRGLSNGISEFCLLTLPVSVRRSLTVFIKRMLHFLVFPNKFQFDFNTLYISDITLFLSSVVSRFHGEDRENRNK